MNFKIISKFLILNLVLGLLSTPVVFIAGFCISGGGIGYRKGPSLSDQITGWGMLLSVLLVFILSNLVLHKSSPVRTEGKDRRNSFIIALIVLVITIVLGISLISII